MSLQINEKQLRIRYIRVAEKFLTRTIYLLKLENFNKDMFIERTIKNLEDYSKTPKVELYSDYYTSLEDFISKTKSFIANKDEDFSTKRAILLKDANLLQKSKNSSRYKKDKHKKDRFSNEYWKREKV